MNPNILAILPGLIPSTIINVTTPLIDLHKKRQINARISLEMFVKDKDFHWSNLVVLCRNIEPMVEHWFMKVLENNKPYIYDIDDNLFELPVDTPLGKKQRSPERIAMLGEYVRHASLVRVYSEPMLERVKSLNPHVVKVYGPLDWRLVTPAPRVMKKGPAKIVYATSRVNDNLVEIFKPALKKILDKYGDQIQFFFLGYNPTEFKSYSNVFFKPLDLNYEKYMRYFSNAGFDIGLAPLFDDVFHRSKTNLKVREYGACRIAGIYSDVNTYSTSVTHQRNGLLVKNTTDAWYSAISLLIENHNLRMQIQEQAYQFVVENFSPEAFAQLWYSQMTKILTQPKTNEETSYNKNAYILQQNKSHSAQEYVTEARTTPIASRDFGIKTGFAKHVSTLLDFVRRFWLWRKLTRLAAGLQSYGLTFLFSMIRMSIQMLWTLLKIKIILFFR